MKDLIIAAHSDDAALSLGGLMLKKKGNIAVLNVFSTCARTILPHTTDAEVITKINNREEEKAMKLLGAELRMLFLREVLLRGHTTWKGPVDYEQDSALIEEIEKTVFHILKTYDSVYIPLAIGDHVDHAILYNTGFNLWEKNVHQNMIFYEDLPYAYYYPDWLERRKRDGFRFESELVDITDYIDEKIAILTTYASQYTPSDLQVVKEYAFSLEKDGRFYERIWKL